MNPLPNQPAKNLATAELTFPDTLASEQLVSNLNHPIKFIHEFHKLLSDICWSTIIMWQSFLFMPQYSSYKHLYTWDNYKTNVHGNDPYHTLSTKINCQNFKGPTITPIWLVLLKK